MGFQLKQKIDPEALEEIFLEASFSGERFVIQRKDGVSVGIVPIEDVAILENMEEELLN